MLFMSTVSQLLVMLLLCLIGLLLRKFGSFNDNRVAFLNLMMVWVAQPGLMMVSTQRSHDTQALLYYMLMVLLGTLAILVVMSLVALYFRKRGRSVYSIMACLSSLPNVGFMGIPVAQAVLGDEVVFYLSAFIIAFNLAQWTLGERIYGKNTSEGSLPAENAKPKRSFNPILAAAILGMLLFALNIHLPPALLGVCQQVSNLNTPLGMIILGARMETLQAWHLLDRQIWTVALIKLILMPLLVCLCLIPFQLPTALYQALVLGSAMPCAVGIQIQAEMHNADKALAARTICLVTILSLFTIPFVMLLIS